MKITCTFDTYEEFLAFTAGGQKEKEPAEPKPAPKPAEPKPAPMPEPEPDPEPVTKEEEAPAVDITVVRKTLTKLNKAMGRNVAKELIKEFGVSKLTEVGAKDLPALLAKAEEMLDA